MASKTKTAKKKAASKKTAPRKAAPRKVAGPPKRKTPVKKKAPKAKQAHHAPPRSVVGGSVSTTTTKVTDGKRSTVDAGSIMLLRDEEFAKAVVDAIKLKFTPEKIAEELEEMLAATVENKHGQAAADYRTRLAVIDKALLTTVGKPLDRVQITESTTWSHEEIANLIEHSPALREALWELLLPHIRADEELRKATLSSLKTSSPKT